MVTIENTFKNWIALSNKYFSGEIQDRDITVTMSPSKQGYIDVICLRYFFPLCHGIHQIGIIPRGERMRLFINMSDIEKNKKEHVIGRIYAFLAAMSRSDEYEIIVDGKIFLGNSKKWDGSNIFPLFLVSSEESDPKQNHYSILRSRKQPSDEFNTGAIAMLYDFRNALKKKVLSVNYYAGTPDSKISKANKEELSNMLNARLSEWLPQMDILAQIIWLSILRILIETKEIWNNTASKTTIVDENKIQKCRIDAVTYGESMYQLVENACLHSDGRNAWFGFRVYAAGGQIAMSDFLSEAITRNQLYSKYKYCYTSITDGGKGKTGGNSIFNRKERFFFELYVLDDAHNQNGILDTYNNTLIKPAYKKLWEQEEDIRRKEWKKACDEDENFKKANPEFVEQTFDEHAIQRLDLWKTATETLKSQGLLAEKIEHILRKKPAKGPFTNNASLLKHIEDITTHYGLRLLQHIVHTNNGYLMCSTPQTQGAVIEHYNGNDAVVQGEKNNHVTEWLAIMPVSYEWTAKQGQPIPLESGGAFGKTVKQKRSKQITIDAKTLFPSVDDRPHTYRCTSVDDKRKYIYYIAKQLSVRLADKSYAQLNDAIVLINLDIDDSWMLELFSKALYSTIAKIRYSQNEVISLRIALTFTNIDFCNEFIRLFSMFYVDGTQDDMADTQIAICSLDEDDLYQCNYILAGTDLDCVWESANASAHYGSKETLDRLPVLAYLIQSESNGRQNHAEKTRLELFPFDLYLDTFESQINPWKNSWFIDRMNCLLKKDLQSSNNGCLLQDVHIRLGSKVHLPCFYEAQLLFHDSSYIFRFAYLVAQDLLYGSNALSVNKHIFLLGYEKYSAQFVQQINYWLSQSENYESVNTAIIRDGTEEGTVLFERLFDESQCFSNAGIQVVSLTPVGTTMSTIYKMHHTARSAFPDVFAKADFSRNYCMVLVNDELSNLSGTISEVTRRYWSILEPEKKLVTLQRERNDSQEAKVKYLLPAAAQWIAPDECTLCRETASDIRPVITVTKSDVMPNSIFLFRSKEHGFFNNFMSSDAIITNNKRIYRLFGNIWYSHIYEKNNHFQFYIDFKKLFRDNEQDIIETIQGWEIQRNAYNIVVSPLLVENSPFVQAVLDHIFHGNSKFVHLEFSKSYREEVRSKYSHISEEIKILRKANPNARINVYFVDISIISGSVINRAKVLLQMLLEESGINYDNVALFEKIFLLVNRCSYDTMNSFIRNPLDNLKTYINLSVPSYNVDEGICPACNLASKYRLLKKRSATDSLGKMFMRLEEKHKKRQRAEYEAWLKCKILDDPFYFMWLKQWLFTNVSVVQKRILFFDPICRETYYQRLSDSNKNLEEKEFQTAQWLKEIIEDYYANKTGRIATETGADKDTLAKVLEFYRIKHKINIDKETEATKNIVLIHLIGMRNYMRLHSLHTAYQALEQATRNIEHLGYSTTENQYKSVRKAMLKLIADAILSNSESNAKYKDMVLGIEEETQSRFQFISSIEWLISYVKVLSREHLANHYCYRQAIASIMCDLLNLSASQDRLNKNYEKLTREDKNWAVIADAVMPLYSERASEDEKSLFAVYHYHLSMMLLHRMADLQMRTVIQTDFIVKSVLQYHRWKKLCNNNSSIKGWMLPPEEDVINRYLKALKASTMALDDDIPCLSLCKTVDELAQRIKRFDNCSDDTKFFGEIVKIGRCIYLENVRMIYSGLCDLKKQIPQAQLKELENHRPCDNFHDFIKSLNETVESCLLKCYSNLDDSANEEDILYQNPLGNFCRFWHRANHCSPVSLPPQKNEINTVTYMLLYFIRLEMLSKLKETTGAIDELPYQYEELCRTICGFTGAKMCYLVYCNDGNYPEIFSQSGYYIPFFQKGQILTAQAMDTIIQIAHCRKNTSSDTCNILLPDIMQVNSKGQGFLVLNLALRGEINTGKHFHIVLQYEKPHSDFSADKIIGIDALRHARDILFMRETLQEVLSEHYTILANLRFDCSYIRPIKQPELGENPNPAVLHFSDLHVSKNMTEYIDDPRNAIGIYLDKVLAVRKIDLLAITGDIADGSGGDAYHLINNYSNAQILLNYIVKKLWGDNTNYLPHDWKRRIVITTGNHDYASMNQFKTVLKQRVLAVGTPVEEDGGTMSKFAYFIDFLIRYLDPPVDELLQNDLNEIRYYRNLNLKVLVLNCSSNATARRTNKLGLNYNKVEALLKRKVWTSNNTQNTYHPIPFRLCLAHYSDKYSLSYFVDNYNVIPGWEWDTTKSKDCVINQLVYCFSSAMKAELVYTKAALLNQEANAIFDLPGEVKDKVIPQWVKVMLLTARKELCNRVEFFNKAMNEWEKNCSPACPAHEQYHKRLQEYYIQINTPQTRISKKDLTESIRHNDLYKDILYYYNWIKDWESLPDIHARTDERISRLVFQINESLSMSEHDKSRYLDLFLDNTTSTRNIDLLLAGHIHAYAETDGTLVADKMLNDGTDTINGYVVYDMQVEIDKDGKRIPKYHHKKMQADSFE